jgi:hypothetical protein
VNLHVRSILDVSHGTLTLQSCRPDWPSTRCEDIEHMRGHSSKHMLHGEGGKFKRLPCIAWRQSVERKFPATLQYLESLSARCKTCGVFRSNDTGGIVVLEDPSQFDTENNSSASDCSDGFLPESQAMEV